MSMIQKLGLSCALVALAACAAPTEVTRLDAPNAALLATEEAAEDLPLISALPGGIRVESVDVIVPRTLKVSEANVYKPAADIVWHEDLTGDRYEQVDEIMTDAIEQAVADMDGETSVTLRVTMAYFHAQTPKVRYTFGGEHELEFTIEVLDAETGVALTQPELFDFDFEAFGGQQALRADAAGITQRMRITEQVIKHVQERFS